MATGKLQKGTRKGRDLCKALGIDPELHGIVASRLCRLGVSYSRIQEARCNGHPAAHRYSVAVAAELQARFSEWLDKREATLERKISDLLPQLPNVRAVKLSGDPRGCTVKLITEDGRNNSWETGCVCVPGA